MQRITFADDAQGTNAYTVPINPTEVDIPSDNLAISKVYTPIDGAKVYLEGVDTYTYRLIWRNWSAEKISAMLSVLESYKYEPAIDNVKYIKLGDIATHVGKFATYTPIRVIDVIKNIRAGSAFIFDSVEVLFEKVI